jgi:hypothetical protein
MSSSVPFPKSPPSPPELVDIFTRHLLSSLYSKGSKQTADDDVLAHYALFDLPALVLLDTTSAYMMRDSF